MATLEKGETNVQEKESLHMSTIPYFPPRTLCNAPKRSFSRIKRNLWHLVWVVLPYRCNHEAPLHKSFALARGCCKHPVKVRSGRQGQDLVLVLNPSSIPGKPVAVRGWSDLCHWGAVLLFGPRAKVFSLTWAGVAADPNLPVAA